MFNVVMVSAHSLLHRIYIFLPYTVINPHLITNRSYLKHFNDFKVFNADALAYEIIHCCLQTQVNPASVQYPSSSPSWRDLAHFGPKNPGQKKQGQKTLAVGLIKPRK